ncbi:conserved membrane hypothetical protein [Flavobacterium sp. 9AF]|uniref:DUF2752 domain-containing protein n=1 Tax=Flavobacterium sp. 9AF TaxID=2653142 RepID=UPI0012F2A73D|nr:DUF2752 domain-containing protein [Flavobacterium sp. 9AF]VXB35836.1 conserved membrane hypothetical protein [Flavobacterium sp. 9AF]
MKKNKLYFLILITCFIGYCWLFYNLKHIKHDSQEVTVCFVKNITNIPCPSCGTTRAVVEISKGNLIDSLFINPFGILVAVIMIVSPFWILLDLIFKRESFYLFYNKIELFLRDKKTAIILIVLVLLNWIWNINKNL